MDIRYIKREDDRNKLAKIYEESWKYAYRGILPDQYLDSLSSMCWNGAFDRDGWHTMVVEEKGDFIGTSTFSQSRLEEYKDDGEIISIYLLPQYMGKGYGSALMEKVLSELKNMGYKRVYLWVLEENMRARSFYERIGFALSGDHMDSTIGGRKVREVRYTLSFG